MAVIIDEFANLEAVLGHEEARILKAIRAFPGDVDSIHFMTGIPRPCIEAKVAALMELGYVVHGDHGYTIAKTKATPLSAKRYLEYTSFHT